MLGFFFLLLSCMSGIGVFQLMPLRLQRAEWLAGGVVTGLFMGAWVTYLCSLVFDYAVGIPVAACVLTIVTAFSWWRKKQLSILPELHTTFWVYFSTNLLCVVLAVVAAYLLQGHFLHIKNGVWQSSGYTWADLALHMSLASAVAHQPHFTMDFSLYHGTPLSYPFLNDFLSGVLVRLGSSWQAAFILPTSVLLGALVTLLLNFVRRLTGSVRAAWLNVFIFLFSGSAWGIVAYVQDALKSGWKVVSQNDYSHLPEQHLEVANIVTSHLLPQRSYLFGIAIACLILVLLLAWNEHRRLVPLVVIGVLLGGLPFIHVHTFFVMTGVVAGYAAVHMLGEKKFSTGFLRLGCIVACGAIPQLLWQFASAFHSNFVTEKIGWLTPANSTMLVFWLRNWGVAIPLIIIAALYCAWKKQDVLMYVLAAAGLALFIAGNVRIFQPNEWDNMKFFTYAYFFLTVPVSYVLSIWTRRWYGVVVVAVCMVFLTVPGILAVYRDTQVHYEFLSKDDLELGDYLNKAIPPDAVVLTSDRHNNPVTLLSGRPIILGYRGWLGSYGINYRQREADVATMLLGGVATNNLFHHYGVSYAVLNDYDNNGFYVNQAYFQRNEILLKKIGPWSVYSIVSAR